MFKYTNIYVSSLHDSAESYMLMINGNRVITG
jgi:hypothetical protein